MKKNTPRYIIIKLLKTSDKEKTIKCSHRAKRHIIYSEITTTKPKRRE